MCNAPRVDSAIAPPPPLEWECNRQRLDCPQAAAYLTLEALVQHVFAAHVAGIGLAYPMLMEHRDEADPLRARAPRGGRHMCDLPFLVCHP